ncbi:MAG TPA: type II secretion system F family protein [Azospirillaceae bacterium]|nr:type II secretion system F family protein [Azospirillaceae bacterium]
MPFDPLYLIYAGIFVTVMLFAEGLFYFVGDLNLGARRAANRRLKLMAGSGDSQAALRQLRRRNAALIDGPLAILSLLSPVRWLDRMILLAGLGITTPVALLAMLAVSLTLFALAMEVLGHLPTQAMLEGALLGIVLPVVALIFHGQNRLKRFGEQLPDALDMIVRSLRAGHPVSTALRLVADDMADPMGTEIGLMVDEMTYGLDMREALERLAQRVDYEDLRYMVVAINIQHSAGGNLSEILAGLSAVIRGRGNMFRKIKVLSAEGRLSAWVIGLLPFVVGGAIMAMNPSYYETVRADPMFGPGLIIAACLYVLGLFSLWRMVSFKV